VSCTPRNPNVVRSIRRPLARSGPRRPAPTCFVPLRPGRQQPVQAEPIPFILGERRCPFCFRVGRFRRFDATGASLVGPICLCFFWSGGSPLSHLSRFLQDLSSLRNQLKCWLFTLAPLTAGCVGVASCRP